jgi:hypothetical protein
MVFFSGISLWAQAASDQYSFAGAAVDTSSNFTSADGCSTGLVDIGSSVEGARGANPKSATPFTLVFIFGTNTCTQTVFIGNGSVSTSEFSSVGGGVGQLPKSITASGQIPVDLNYYSSGQYIGTGADVVTFRVVANLIDGTQASTNYTSFSTYGGAPPVMQIKDISKGSSASASVVETVSTHNFGNLTLANPNGSLQNFTAHGVTVQH